MNKTLKTHDKALHINLNVPCFGSFSEIGAGQEVANNFFRVGGASGTIAKSISAYDKVISNSIYGATSKYVSSERLIQMLDHEYRLLEEQLDDGTKVNKALFCFANTVEVLNYSKSNQGQGWLGVKYQKSPGTLPITIIIHLILHDNDTSRQQEIIGKLGVNLIYACYMFDSPHQLIKFLFDDIDSDLNDINYIKIHQNQRPLIDDRLAALLLVKYNLTEVAMFDTLGNVVQPTNALYKKHLLIQRGRFRPPTKVNEDMMNKGCQKLSVDLNIPADDILKIAELTINNLTHVTDNLIDQKDFIDRAELLHKMGYYVLITKFTTYDSLAKFLLKLIKKKSATFIVGVKNLESIFNEEYYRDLKGGILESFSHLFGNNLQTYVYPFDSESGIINCNQAAIEGNLRILLEYLMKRGKVSDILEFDETCLSIFSEDVLKDIINRNISWKEKVPKTIIDTIESRKLFV